MNIVVNETDYQIEIIPPSLGTIEVTKATTGYILVEDNSNFQVIKNEQDIIIQNNTYNVIIDDSPSKLISPTSVENEIVIEPVVTYVEVSSVGTQGPAGSGSSGSGTLQNVVYYSDQTYSYFVGDVTDGWKCNRWDVLQNLTSATGVTNKPESLVDCQSLSYL